MHSSSIPDAIVRRIEKSRGRLHPFSRIDTAKTAMLVIDMQEFFLSATGANVESAIEIVPTINRLTAVMRQASVPIIFTKHRVNAKDVEERSAYYRHFLSAATTQLLLDRLGDNGTQSHIAHGICKRREDLCLTKSLFSAMAPGSSDLPDILRARDVDTVVIAGALTNICCESTARDAATQGYRVFFVSDATAALTDAEHTGALTSLASVFADVRTTHQMLELLANAKPRSG
ncbi:cysteine hydrolase [Paraburkholderia sp. BCC1885]|uniref:cysteine hydrolase n=1 Tax=Paraburkholderia sp. BCC1885 TaxID=2562669 RepID=UPI0011845A75|nr:cysteine hydrolase [Paraburkholderia sp. BCC1885]